jgi:hypothetical protein
VKRIIPYLNIFFLPFMSASLPKGRRNIAEVRIKLLTIHPSSTAVVLKSFPIEGRARFIADPRKGVRKQPKQIRDEQIFLMTCHKSDYELSAYIHSLFFVSIIMVTGPSLCIPQAS